MRLYAVAVEHTLWKVYLLPAKPAQLERMVTVLTFHVFHVHPEHMGLAPALAACPNVFRVQLEPMELVLN
jgi:hypothetical protein